MVRVHSTNICQETCLLAVEH